MSSTIFYTLAEYKKGSSLNFLGVELGQYYVDYLNQIHQERFLYSIVCKKVFDCIEERYGISVVDLGSQNANRLRYVMLSAVFSNELNERQVHTKGINHVEFKAITENSLFEEYSNCFESISSLSECNIEALVIELGLATRNDALELIRVLMLQKYLGLNGHKTPEQVWQGYLSSLGKTFLNSESLQYLTVDDIYSKMKLITDEQKLEKAAFLVDVHRWSKKLLSHSRTKDYQGFKVALDTQFHAMTNLFVAWTGYRGSEYGFPLSAIQSEPNLDILDSAHVPFRFKLKWFVPKTNGTTKIDREITSKCYQIAAHLNKVFGHNENRPCLYVPSENAHEEKNFQSERYIALRLKANWQGFVETYQPFNDVIALDNLLKKKPIN